MNKLLNLFFLITLNLYNLLAQTNYQIVGKVVILDSVHVNLNTKIQIILLSSDKYIRQAQPDYYGNYSFSNIGAGKYILKILLDSVIYQQRKIVVTVPILYLSDSLRLNTITWKPILIEAAPEFGRTGLNSVQDFGIYEAKKTETINCNTLIANTAANNYRQVFSKISGINIWESDPAGLQLGVGSRGLSPSRIEHFNVRQNGYDISADALGYPESYYTPPVEALSIIEVVRGAGALQYGTQFGGMLNFRFKEPNPGRKISAVLRQTAGSWNFLSTFGSLSGTLPKAKFSYYTYFLYKKGDGYRSNSNFKYQNGFAALYYEPTQRLKLQLDITQMKYLAQQPGGLTDQQLLQNPRQSFRSRNWFEVDWHIFSLIVNYTLSGSTKIQSRNFALIAKRQSLGNLERIHIADLGQNRTLILGEFKNIGNETRLIHQISTARAIHTVLAGIRMYHGNTHAAQGDADASNRPTFEFLNPNALENSDYQFKNRNYAAFLEAIYYLTPKLSITPGVRAEIIYTQATGYYNLRVLDGASNLVAAAQYPESQSRYRHFAIAGLGAQYRFSNRWQIFANITQNYRAVQFTDLRIDNPNLRVASDIKDEKGYSADISCKYINTNKIQLELAAFRIQYQGKIGQILRVDQPPLYLDYRLRTNISDAFSQGLEAFVQVALGKYLQLYTNATYIDARYFRSSDQSIQNKKVELVPPVIIRNGLEFNFRSFAASLQFAYTGQHFSDATNAVRTTSAIEGLIPAYAVTDISARYTFRRWRIEGSINNIFNSTYFTRRAVSYPGPGILPADGRGFYSTIQFML
jgi:Fe(3+) dicitrate transport protein